MDILKRQVAGLLTQYIKDSSSKEDKKEAGELLALVHEDIFRETHLRVAADLEPDDGLTGFLRGVAKQPGQSTTHMLPCCQHGQHPYQ
jgi:hypothetical protein